MLQITLSSIFIITGLTWAARHFMRQAMRELFCPICAGVSVTWLWMLVAFHAGKPIDPVMLGLLMGGTVVGLAYRIEPHLHPRRSSLLWKTCFIPLGFAAAFFLIKGAWLFGASATFLLAALPFLFIRQKKQDVSEKEIDEIEKKLKQCC